jgi:hypothetical protein
MITPEVVSELYKARMNEREPIITAMQEIRDVVNGDVLIPLPEMDEADKPAVANLVAEGIEQTSLRIASTMPNLIVPALDPRIAKGAKSIDWADTRRKAYLGWYKDNRLRRRHRRKAMHLVAYGSAVTQVKPDFERGIPAWRQRNPLFTFPRPQENDYDDFWPDDCIFAYRKPYSWIKERYPAACSQIYKGPHYTVRDEDESELRAKLFTILEYVDANETVLVLCGQEDTYGDPSYPMWAAAVELERMPNLCGYANVIVPGRMTLDRMVGQFNQTLGLYFNQAKLVALDLIATTKSVFPDIALVSRDGNAPTLLGDEWKDGLSGEINEITNGEIQVVQLQPGYKTGEAIDRLERSMRLTGIAPQFGGENPTNIRTGRAAEVAMSAQVDFRIQSYQETMADSLALETELAYHIMKAYFKGKKSFSVGSKTEDYEVGKHLESPLLEVVYPMPGADVNGLMLGIGNRVGLGMMSLDSGRRLDPLIEDPDKEADAVVGERLDTAMLEGLGQMAASGALPPADLAAIKRKVLRNNMDLADAVVEAQREAQERQAAEAPQGSPETQPGIAAPGAGAESGQLVPEPPTGMDRLQSLLMSLRQPGGPRGGTPSPMAEGAAS